MYDATIFVTDGRMDSAILGVLNTQQPIHYQWADIQNKLSRLDTEFALN